MTTTITYRDGVAIGTVVVYLPILILAIILAIRHGFGRSSGWLFLIIFALIRIVGSCFEMATINDRSNTSLYIGVAILQNIGLSPLELISMGLLSRIISNINKTSRTAIQPMHIKFAELLVTIALILGIVGGVNSSGHFSKFGVYIVSTLSKASLGLLIATYVLIIIFTGLVSMSISHADHGEKRVLLAVVLSLPFMLVRLIYSALYTFGGHKNFSSLSGSVTLYLVLALIMELIACIIYEAVGLTLKKVPKTPVGVPLESYGSGGSQGGRPQKPLAEPSAGSKIASFLGQRTIIGRMIVRSSGGRQQRGADVNGFQRQYR